jgi:multidrug transporter EmrE-like cation transporter
MDWIYALLAAFLFAAGGFFMKISQGALKSPATAAFLGLFIAGALLQARAMRRADMGAVYVAVLGLEAAFALALSTGILHEHLSWQRIAAAVLIVAGVSLLRLS